MPPYLMPLGHRLTLPDGRFLAYIDWGPSHGVPVFFFNGSPSTRHFSPGGRLRIITTDRPGYGESDAKPGRSVLDWADDVAALAEALHIPRFVACGVSGGAPHAAAVAHRLPERVAHLVLISGALPGFGRGTVRDYAPADALEVHMARLPWPVSLMLFRLATYPLRRNPESVLGRVLKDARKGDENGVGDGLGLVRLIRDGLRSGVEAYAWEMHLFVRDWGFSLEELKVPITIWHGAVDHTVPARLAVAAARRVPTARLHLLPDDDHYLIARRWPEIEADILAAWPDADRALPRRTR